MKVLQILLPVIISAMGGLLFALILKFIFIKENKLSFHNKIRLVKHILFKSENVIYIEISDFDLQCFLKDYKYNIDTMSTLNKYCEMQILKDIANQFNETDVVLEKALFQAKIEEKSKEASK